MAAFHCRRVSMVCSRPYAQNLSTCTRTLSNIHLKQCKKRRTTETSQVLPQPRYLQAQTSLKFTPTYLNDFRLSHAVLGANVIQKVQTSPAILPCRSLMSGVLTSVAKDLDLEEFRKQVRKGGKEGGDSPHLITKMRELAEEKVKERMGNLTDEERKKLQVIQLEHNFMYSEGFSVPSPEKMKDEYWLEAIQLDSLAQRRKFYIFLLKRLRLQQRDLRKKEERKKLSAAHREEKMKNAEASNHIMLRLYDTTVKRWLNNRLASSMTLGPPLIVDMDYAHIMRHAELKNTANQLHSLYFLNRADEKEPFHLFFTGCADDNPVERLWNIMFQEHEHILATVTPKSYLDLFNKKDLVYLSPHGRKVMSKFDPEAVYIIGGFNDKHAQKQESYARAMEQGLRCERLPLDENLVWVQGRKALSLDIMMKIMTVVKNGGTWQEAFRNIPDRNVFRKR